MRPQEYISNLWLDCTLEPVESIQKTIINKLSGVNIRCCLEEPASNSMASLVLFNDTCDEVQEKSHIKQLLNKGFRVILLYTGKKLLPFYKTWKYLSAGIEEVLVMNRHLKLGELIQSRLKRWAIIDKMVNSELVRTSIIGTSQEWTKILRQVVEVACFSTAPILVLGESGTGKEQVSRLIHKLDKRPDKQELVLLDCTTIVPELSGSEFFGHEKGAFTNAVSNRDGAFALANRGTLFLDEVGELPMSLQAELLRISQEGLYKRVGSNQWQKTQFRLVCATNRNLQSEIENGNFRQDLYYRLSTCIIKLPALRDRMSDIPGLVDFFLKQILKTDSPPVLSPYITHFLMTRPYPGNVRELKQLVTRMAYRYTGKGIITLGDIPEADRDIHAFEEDSWLERGFKDAISRALADGVSLKSIKKTAGDIAINIAIEHAEGNLQKAAQMLDVSDRTLQVHEASKRKEKD